jgi:BirA family biotin operon repressor/biotin-[acetyl-CoA-carboxylase] ligase
MALDVEWIRVRLPGRGVSYFEITGSTMADAARLAAAGCPSGTLAVAEEQVSGQGRQGRSWHSERESGLYVSFVLRIPIAPHDAPLLALGLGLAAAEAISRTADVACDLRWPNDVLIEGKKCAGILVLCEESAFVAGIGINVNQAAFPPDLAELATSLRIVTGLYHSRERLLVELAGAVDSFVRMLVEGGRGPILRMFARASSYVSGKRVVVEQGDRNIVGTTEGLNDSGFLIVRKDDGATSLIVAGGVRPAAETDH